VSLDHGILNMPLSKRGNIDAQIDAHKASQARTEAAQRKEVAAAFKADKALAKTALVEILATPKLIEAKAESLGVKRADLVKQLDGWAKWEPKRLIALSVRWLP
jgi:hypothetical protein